MALEEDDWRLTNQQSYLEGVKLVHRRYRRYAENPDWDHDHCEFCWAKFMVEDQPDALHVGYATEDDYHWVCERCFADFRDMFGWVPLRILPDKRIKLTHRSAEMDSMTLPGRPGARCCTYLQEIG